MLQAAKRELERQRQLEWERNRRQELLNQRNKEQEDIVVLKAKKKTLEFELEALVSNHDVDKALEHSSVCDMAVFIFCNFSFYIWSKISF